MRWRQSEERDCGREREGEKYVKQQTKENEKERFEKEKNEEMRDERMQRKRWRTRREGVGVSRIAK